MSSLPPSTLDSLGSTTFPSVPPQTSSLDEADLEAAIGLIPTTFASAPPAGTQSSPSDPNTLTSIWPSQFPTLATPALPTSQPPSFSPPPPRPRSLPSSSPQHQHRHHHHHHHQHHHQTPSAPALSHIPAPESIHSPHPAPKYPSSQDDAHSVSKPAVAPVLPQIDDPSSSTVSAHDPPFLPPSTSQPSSSKSTPRPGLSAVDLAKRAAEEFTLVELAKKRRDANGVPLARTKSNNGDLWCSDDDRPEKVSHRKYQKRLQKNRDSAFVSRIRRREYTRVLESSLLQVEKEKEAAVARFVDMKRRFELVSAELNGMKQAAQSNFAQLRESLVGRAESTEENAEQGPVRAGGSVTMFMIALVFGTMLPDWVDGNVGLTRRSMSAFLPRFGAAVNRGLDRDLGDVGGSRKSGKGSVWGGAARKMGAKDEVVLPTVQLVIAHVQQDVEEVFRKEEAVSLMNKLEDHVRKLSETKVEELWSRLQESRLEYGAAADRVASLMKCLREREEGDRDGALETMLTKLRKASMSGEA